MKLKTGVSPSKLLEYNFEENTKEYKESMGIDEYDTLNFFEGYLFNLGHSRRGQFYYLMCNLKGGFSIFASKPDGSGGILPIADQEIFVKLFTDGLIE